MNAFCGTDDSYHQETGMRIRGLLVLCFAVCADASTCSAETLSPQLTSLADQIQVAWHRQNSVLAWKLLQGPVRRFGSEQLARLDGALKDRELPASAAILADARLSIVQQNLRIRLPEPSFKERLLLIQGQQQRTDALLSEITSSLAELTEKEAPRTRHEFDGRFWTMHILRNRLLSAERFQRDAADLASRVKSLALSRLDESLRNRIHQLQKSPFADVQRLQSELAALELSIRHQRLDFSITALNRDKLDQEKFAAAFAVRLDADALSRLDLDRIEEEETRREITSSLARAESALQADRMLADKATDFFVGLHWWQRGRFGIGTEVYGLAKSESALHSPDGLVWLNMPLQPQPPEASTGRQLEVPQGPFHRRHHLIWAWEDREVQFRNSVQETPLEAQRMQQYTLSTFY